MTKHDQRCSRMFALSLLLTMLLASASPAVAEDLRVYHIGNSLTDGVLHGQLDKMAERAGHEHVWGAHLIWGTPLDYMWTHGQPHDHNDDGKLTSEEETLGGASKLAGVGELKARFWNVLPAQQLDAVTLQPYQRYAPSDFAAIAQFVNLLKLEPKNLDSDGKVKTRVYLFQHWPHRKVTGDKDAAKQDRTYERGFFQAEWDRKYTWQGFGEDGDTHRGRDYFKTLITALNDPSQVGQDMPAPSGTAPLKLPLVVAWGEQREQQLKLTHPAKLLAEPVRLIPVGDVLYALESRLQEEIKQSGAQGVREKYGISSVEDFYADSVHFNARGHYVQTLTFYSVLYGADPVGIPPANLEDANDNFVRLVQQVVQSATKDSGE